MHAKHDTESGVIFLDSGVRRNDDMRQPDSAIILVRHTGESRYPVLFLFATPVFTGMTEELDSNVECLILNF